MPCRIDFFTKLKFWKISVILPLFSLILNSLKHIVEVLRPYAQVSQEVLSELIVCDASISMIQKNCIFSDHKHLFVVKISLNSYISKAKETTWAYSDFLLKCYRQIGVGIVVLYFGWWFFLIAYYRNWEMSNIISFRMTHSK